MPNSCSYKEVQKEGKAGTYFECKLTGVITKETAANNLLMDFMRDYEYIVLLNDRNGNIKIIGNPWKGMRFSSDLDLGIDAKDENRYLISLDYTCETRPQMFTPI